jgi:energy-coupling factor transporter ATP-binding protein EcfA2
MFRAIIADDFAPFGKLALELQPVPDGPGALGEVHLFTGVNGTGKTRLLSLIAAMLGNPSPLSKRMKGIASPIFGAVSGKVQKPPLPVEFLRTNQMAQLPGQSWNIFHLQQGGINWVQMGVPDFHPWLNSVPAFAYRGSPYVADADVKSLVVVPSPDRAACLSFDRASETSQPLLQAIANLMVQAALETLDPQSSADSRGASAKLVRALESALTQITGFEFKFFLQSKPNISLSVFWGGVKLYFDVLPDGLRSIIGWMVHALVMMDLWFQGKKAPMESEAVFLLDEIENQLHPAWQRRVLPAFQHLFPKAQIFVATHSPFVIASLNHGWIHQLTMTSDGKVKVERPVQANKGDSYISVVEDIMGMKEWYDVETEKLLAEFRSKRDNAYRGDVEAEKEARQLARKIGAGSMELDFMMGKELIQMDRQLAKQAAPK